MATFKATSRMRSLLSVVALAAATSACAADNSSSQRDAQPDYDASDLGSDDDGDLTRDSDPTDAQDGDLADLADALADIVLDPNDQIPPTASLLPVSGALLAPHETIVVRFSEYMNPRSLVVTGDLAEGGRWWRSPYEVLLLFPPQDGWATGGSISVFASDRGGNPTPIVSASYPGVADVPQVLNVPVRAFRFSNDDGSKETPLTADQAAIWNDEANRIYEPAGVFLDFDPADEDAWFEVNDTAINTIWALSEPEVLEHANAFAANYPGTLNQFFVWGPLDESSYGGFSSNTLGYVAGGGYEGNLLCGHNPISLVAHETGHYFGLFHTHMAEFWTLDEAQEAYDGAFLPWDDGLADTPAVPHIRETLCDPPDSIELGGIERVTWAENVMNYDDVLEQVLSWSQMRLLRHSAGVRFDIDLRRQVTPTADLFVEGEDLPRVSGAWHVQDTMHAFGGLWSRDAHALWLNESEGGTASLTFVVPEAGTYRLFASLTRGPDFGIHRLSVGDTNEATVDAYAPTVHNVGVLDLGAFEMVAGDNTLEVANEGRNPHSSGYLFGLDYLLLRQESGL